MAVADGGELPRRLGRRTRPAMIEQAAEREHLGVEHDVLGVGVPDRGRPARRSPPRCPSAARRSGSGRGWRPGCRPSAARRVKRLDVVDDGAGMQLDADQQVGVLGAANSLSVAPVRRHGALPLLLVDALEVGQPAAGGEVRRAIARRGRAGSRPWPRRGPRRAARRGGWSRAGPGRGAGRARRVGCSGLPQAFSAATAKPRSCDSPSQRGARRGSR